MLLCVCVGVLLSVCVCVCVGVLLWVCVWGCVALGEGGEGREGEGLLSVCVVCCFGRRVGVGVGVWVWVGGRGGEEGFFLGRGEGEGALGGGRVRERGGREGG